MIIFIIFIHIDNTIRSGNPRLDLSDFNVTHPRFNNHMSEILELRNLR